LGDAQVLEGEEKKLPGYFECGVVTHFIANFPKRKKYDYTNKNDNKNNHTKKNHFEDKKKSL
jgi:hypothetical protein